MSVQSVGPHGFRQVMGDPSRSLTVFIDGTEGGRPYRLFRR